MKSSIEGFSTRYEFIASSQSAKIINQRGYITKRQRDYRQSYVDNVASMSDEKLVTQKDLMLNMGRHKLVVYQVCFTYKI